MPGHGHTFGQCDARESALLGVSLLGHVVGGVPMARECKREIGECSGKMQVVFGGGVNPPLKGAKDKG
jgi:hypothetical protein